MGVAAGPLALLETCSVPTYMHTDIVHAHHLLYCTYSNLTCVHAKRQISLQHQTPATQTHLTPRKPTTPGCDGLKPNGRPARGHAEGRAAGVAAPSAPGNQAWEAQVEKVRRSK
jgi:hypothetical protein